MKQTPTLVTCRIGPSKNSFYGSPIRRNGSGRCLRKRLSCRVTCKGLYTRPLCPWLEDRCVAFVGKRSVEKYFMKHRTASAPVKYDVMEMSDLDEFAVGSELVPLDEPVTVCLQQRGYFPLLDPLIRREMELDVLLTRDIAIADAWARQRSAEQIPWLSYVIRERPIQLKIGQKLAYYPDSNANKDDYEGAADLNREWEDEAEEIEKSVSMDTHLASRLDAFHDFSEEEGEATTQTDTNLESDETESIRQESADIRELLRDIDPLGNELFDYYPEIAEWETVKKKRESYVEPIEYRVGNIIIVDRNPPQRKGLPPLPTLRPTAFTRDPILAEMWRGDKDGGAETTTLLPEDAIPIARNVISLLAICQGKHVLIVQLRRMRAIGPALYNLLYNRNIDKLTFNHVETSRLLKAIGVEINAGHEVTHMLTELVRLYPHLNELTTMVSVSATERVFYDEVIPPLRTLKKHQLIRVLAGVDVSDRDFYVDEWNNPLLCEREVACIAKEAYAVYAMALALNQANRTHFFNIDIFIRNPLPPSYIHTAEQSPSTVTQHFIVNRGRFYEDMGRLLQGMSFNVSITCTKSAAVVENWVQRNVLDEGIEQLGYSQEWLKGQSGEITAIFVVATMEAVLICQQLYMSYIPIKMRNLLQYRHIRKCGPSRQLRVFKKNQSDLILRGVEPLPLLLMELCGKAKKKNVPKVVRDMDFPEAARFFIAPEWEWTDEMSDTVRWDKPSFSTEEVVYQAMRAWIGWALLHILSQSTIHHSERLRAYLQGESFVPRKTRVARSVQHRMKTRETTFSDTDSLPRDGGEMSIVDRLASNETTHISQSDLNSLVDTVM